MTVRSMRSGFRLLFAFSLIAGAGSAVLADPITAATRAVASSNTINLYKINGVNNRNLLGVNLAQFWSKTGGTVGTSYASGNSAEFRTFCVDLYHPLVGTSTSPGTIEMAFQNANGSTPDGNVNDLNSPSHPRDMGKVGWLLQNYGAGVDSGVGWGVGALASLVTVADRASALQAAVWVAAFNVTSFETNSRAVYSAANYLLGQLRQSSTNRAAVGLIDYAPWPGNASHNVSPTSQDQAYALGRVGTTVVAVPEPSTFAIAGLGALAFAGYGLRRRRSLDAAA